MPDKYRTFAEPQSGLTVAKVSRRLRADGLLTPPGAETVAERVQRLQAEANALACEHIGALERALETVYRLSTQVTEGGAAYEPDIRDAADRIAERALSQRQTIAVLMQRAPALRS